MKNKKIILMALACYTISFSSMGKVNANAASEIKDLTNKSETGRVEYEYYNEDYSFISNMRDVASGDENFFMKRNELIPTEVRNVDKVSSQEYLESTDDKTYVKNVDTNEYYDLATLAQKLEANLQKYFNINGELMWLDPVYSTNNDMWMQFGYYEEITGNGGSGYISENGKVIETEGAGFSESNQNNKKESKELFLQEVVVNGIIVRPVYQEDELIVINQNSEFIQTINGKEILKAYDDYIVVKEVEKPSTLNFYKFKNDKFYLEKSVEVPFIDSEACSYELDSKGNIWMKKGEYLSILNNGDIEHKYKVDTQLVEIEIHDEDNFILQNLWDSKYMIVKNGQVVNPYKWDYNNGNYYLHNLNGEKQYGWKNVSGKDYYMDSNGAMQSNKWIGDYYVGASGDCFYDKWIGDYYVDSTGKYVKDRWVGDYYCDASGKYAKNTWVGDYYCDNSGRYVKNVWVGDYYCDNTGKYVKDTWIEDYYCSSTGKYVKEMWIGDYYCGSTGKYVKEMWIGDYYCGSTGKYVKEMWVGDYYCDASGKYVKNQWVQTDGWYYCGEDGAYVKSTSKTINGKTYDFNENGLCLNP